jgi:hypothetical protein
MLTNKKTIFILLIAGLVSFLTGLILISYSSLKNEFILALWLIQSILIFGIISIGLGCYLAGSGRPRNNRSSYTIDFSKPK